MDHYGLSTRTTHSISQKPTVIVTFLLVLVVTAGISGYLLGSKTIQSISPPQSPPPTLINTETPSPTPHLSVGSSGTADWKTYTNFVIGYTMRYPDTVQISKLSERDIEITRFGVLYGGQEGKVPLGGMALYWRGEEGLERGNDMPGMPVERITINGYPAERVRYSPQRPHIDNIFIADPTNRRVVRAAINTSGDVGFEESTYELFHEMLSTITFID